MRNNIVFKFIAVILCAAALLGIVGSGLSILAMTEMNLYNKSVDQVIEDRIRVSGAEIAQRVANRYASMELGGCPEEMAWHRFPNYGGFLNTYGYTLLDSEGNVLDSDPLDSGNTKAKTYTFPISGQYIHLVSSKEKASEVMSAALNPEAYTLYSPDGKTRLFSAIPEEGAAIYGLLFGCADGSVYDHRDSSVPLGAAHYSKDGNVICIITQDYIDLPHHTDITSIHMLDGNMDIIYEASSPDSVGFFTNSGSSTVFVSSISVEEATEETSPETIAAETIPETVPESVPQIVPETVQETVAVIVPEILPETVPETSAETEPEAAEAQEEAGAEEAEEEPSSASDIPEENPVEAAEETAAPTEAPTIPATEPPATEAATEPPVTEAATEPPAEETIDTTEPAAAGPVTINGKPLTEFEINKTQYRDGNTGKEMVAEYVYVPMPEYTLELHINEDSISNKEAYELLEIVQDCRRQLLPLLGASIAVFVIFGIYLCCAAGHKPKSTEIRPGGLNRIPLDLYLGLGFCAVMGLAVAASEGSLYLMRQSTTMLSLACAAGCGFAACLIIVGFLFACLAQFKTPGGFWYRNTLFGHCVRWFFRFAVWLEKWLEASCLPFLGRSIKAAWKIILSLLISAYRLTEKAFQWSGTVLGRFFRWIGHKLHRFLTLLPLTWQWLLVGALMVVVIFATDGHFLSFVFGLCIILYASHCFGLLAESTRRMSKGDLDTMVDDKLMVGSFQEFATDLNALADVAVVAAQKQLKSERMKTELITNVSHDIKTPLTSIINYVDLLQKPHTEEEGQQYLEVLDRQSQRLKKLIEDLMDMSKASTGNMSVDITRVDAVESVNQALGEFADKLDKADLTPVFRHTEESVPMMADGKLVWRVLSNLLGNAVKYAMPGTRLYVDLSTMEGKVVISLKNISREELNLDADELMERFVRGDDSRNTEGSGLGLNIARSLMELQKGQLKLLVDGDLFKVTLIFPGA